jgi:hypothetical protein
MHIEDPKERQVFLKTDPGVTATMLAPNPSPTPAAVSFDAATLDRLAQALAPYVGPIAKILVANTARKVRSGEELRNALAAEVPDADRKRFLAAIKNLAF